MTALVTGAGSGIGKRLSELLLARGDDVIALDVSFSDEARAALSASGSKVHFESVDVRDGEAVRAAVDAGVAALGKPKLAINCAGVAIAKPFEETSEEDYRRVVDINLYGSRNVAAATLPYLEGGGKLALVASMAGFVGNYAYAAYCSSKFGVVGLAEVLRIEQKPKGVTICLIAPPEIMTPLVEEERRIGSPIAGQMKQFAGSLELEPAVQAILKGVDSGRFLIVPGAKAKQTLLLQRLAPRRVLHAVTDQLLRRAVRGQSST
jgi:NAD(P)-dependent dehydrogenase (short-subunit alcohol dehydrogenase family)